MIEPLRRTLNLTTPDGSGQVALLDFGDQGRPVDIVFAHANGFNALTYRQALAPLGETMRIIAFDQRGHGRTTLPADAEGREDWTGFERDLIAVLDALDLDRPVVLSGHSMGGSASLMAASKLGGRVSQLILFEPVVPKRPSRPGPDQHQGLIALSDGALRRRTTFASWAAAVDAYRGRGAFRTWPDAMLADFVEDGFIDLANGTVRLACAPVWEASNFRAQNQPALDLLLATTHPTRVLRGAAGSTCSINDDDPRVLGNPVLRIETVPETTHFLPMERIDLVQAALRDAARG